mmetsp:Transcript_29427/g.75359  ORF Transcript_29427/g.75359 Transcript_29427/m.75359 type:complete len:238 (+) Transcript_29427:4031-4744(+)
MTTHSHTIPATTAASRLHLEELCGSMYADRKADGEGHHLSDPCPPDIAEDHMDPDMISVVARTILGLLFSGRTTSVSGMEGSGRFEVTAELWWEIKSMPDEPGGFQLASEDSSDPYPAMLVCCRTRPRPFPRSERLRLPPVGTSRVRLEDPTGMGVDRSATVERTAGAPPCTHRRISSRMGFSWATTALLESLFAASLRVSRPTGLLIFAAPRGAGEDDSDPTEYAEEGHTGSKGCT